MKTPTNISNTLSDIPSSDTRASAVAESLTFIQNERTIIHGAFRRSHSDVSIESFISNDSSDGADDESKTPLTANDTRDDWIDELIELAVDHYQQRCYKAVYDSAYFEEKLDGLESTEMDDISEEYHRSYMKYITFYIKFDALFINNSFSKKEVIDEGMGFFEYSGAKLSTRGFEAYLMTHFHDTFGYSLTAIEGTGASDTSALNVTPPPEAMANMKSLSLQTQDSSSVYLTPVRQKPTESKGVVLNHQERSPSSSAFFFITPGKQTPTESNGYFLNHKVEIPSSSASLLDETMARTQSLSFKTSSLNAVYVTPERPKSSLNSRYFFAVMAGGLSGGANLPSIDRKKKFEVSTNTFDFFKKIPRIEAQDDLEKVKDAFGAPVSLGSTKSGVR